MVIDHLGFSFMLTWEGPRAEYIDSPRFLLPHTALPCCSECSVTSAADVHNATLCWKYLDTVHFKYLYFVTSLAKQ